MCDCGMKTESIDNWDNKPLKHKKNKYPTPVDKNSPRMFFVGLFVGSRGSGKTFSIAKLIKQYEHYGIVDADNHEKVAQRVILFSPTIEANPILSSLKDMNDDDIVT
jgi:Ni2+-binding GTPase involved in maturation of urease and hydrogenase